jgi:hypothetical protein
MGVFEADGKKAGEIAFKIAPKLTEIAGGGTATPSV